MKPTTSDDGDPPEERHLELAADIVAEQRLGDRPAPQRDAGGAGQDDREAERQAGQREQRCQRDDEGRHLGADHDEPVDEADDEAEAERREDPDDDRQPK